MDDDIVLIYGMFNFRGRTNGGTQIDFHGFNAETYTKYNELLMVSGIGTGPEKSLCIFQGDYALPSYPSVQWAAVKTHS